MLHCFLRAHGLKNSNNEYFSYLYFDVVSSSCAYRNRLSFPQLLCSQFSSRMEDSHYIFTKEWTLCNQGCGKYNQVQPQLLWGEGKNKIQREEKCSLKFLQLLSLKSHLCFQVSGRDGGACLINSCCRSSLFTHGGMCFIFTANIRLFSVHPRLLDLVSWIIFLSHSDYPSAFHHNPPVRSEQISISKTH